MSVELQERALQAVELARKAGADDVWATAVQARSVQFEYRKGALEKVQDTTSRALSLQLYVGGRYSSHQTTDLDPDRMKGFLAEAVAITQALEPDASRQITPPALFEDRPQQPLDLVDPEVQRIEREQRIAWCRAIDEVATSHPRVISATASVNDGGTQAASASSNGFLGTQESTYCWYGASVTLKDRDDRRAEDGFYAGGTHLEGLPRAEDVARTALGRALSRLDAGKGPTARATMVVDARAAASLVARLLGPANARSIQQGRSFWSSLQGQQAFSKVLTLEDDPLIPRGLGSRYYDDEGISARRLPLVEAGVVRNFYVDTYYGRKAGLAPTTGSQSNVRMQPGTRSLAELLAGVGSGIYVTSWLGGNTDSTTGDFSLGLRGHVIQEGQIGRPVGEMNVTGNLLSLFGRLEMVGNDPYPYSTTLAPSLVFADVDFSGA